MAGLEALQTRLSRVESLRSVVRTMKAMAMVNQHTFEKAHRSTSAYSATVELALQAVLQQRRFSAAAPGPLQQQPESQNFSSVVVVIFGSDHGLCGAFNEQIVSHARAVVQGLNPLPQRVRCLIVGTRLLPLMAPNGLSADECLALPASLSGVPELIDQLLLAIPCSPSNPELCSLGLPERILLVHHRPAGQASTSPWFSQLLPLEQAWLSELEQRPWASTSQPACSTPWETLFPLVVEEYLGICLHQAAVASMASENIARLLAMHAAESNIDERLARLRQDYRQLRQGVITDELLDIVSGFEALRQQNGNE
ncbi:MAG: F0F1 ATP synthase subunit gamma [Cyanobium sp.]